MARELLAGWGRTSPSAADVCRPGRAEEVLAVLDGAPARGAIARGLGRSYGDAAQNAGGTVVSTAHLAGVAWADEGAGLVVAAGGTSLHDVLRFLLPRGWTLPVVPGTRHVTVGGAVAADVHGKNHPADGSFAGHVTGLTLATPKGVVRVGPDEEAPLFWATAGGLGLTGVVLDATLQAVPIQAPAVRVVTRRAADLDGAMAAMEAADGRHRYAVAWLDAHSHRGVIGWADHATAGDVVDRARTAAHVSIPAWLPARPLPAAAVATLNRLRYRRAPASETTTVEPLEHFLFPLDGIEGWNRLYGRAGLVQYQFVVPYAAADLVGATLARLRRADCPPALAVLKRLGAADPGPLSFPLPGWTLAVDFPTGVPGLAAVLDTLDELVAAAGGRVYLAKDARLRPELVGAMYPQVERWRAVQREVDPAAVLRSDLGRRLGLVGPGAG